MYWTAMGLTLLMMFLLPLLGLSLSKILLNDKEKPTPFECGFSPLSTPRSPFSTHFFIIALLFIIFDLEIILLIPLPTINQSTPTTSALILFITLLTWGLLHEWKWKSLDWK